MPFVEVVELALYHREHGFYSNGGQAGRRGDFITSPEVGPLFGHLVSRAIDREWDRLGQPEVFTVVDYGAGPGTLARAILAAAPECREAMRYIAVEQSVAQRAQHPEEVLSLDALRPGDGVVGDGFVGVVLANELLDNLAFAPAERDELGVLRYLEVAVGESDQLVTSPGAEVGVETARLFDDTVGAVVVQRAAAEWLEVTRSLLIEGGVIVIDYARTASELVEMRTYAEHGSAGSPIDAVGTKDITVDVDLQQLQSAVVPASSIQTQADWLASLGIEELVEEGRRLWEAGAATGSLAALKARSRIREAEALTEASGLGGFLVAYWQR